MHISPSRTWELLLAEPALDLRQTLHRLQWNKMLARLVVVDHQVLHPARILWLSHGLALPAGCRPLTRRALSRSAGARGAACFAWVRFVILMVGILLRAGILLLLCGGLGAVFPGTCTAWSFPLKLKPKPLLQGGGAIINPVSINSSPCGLWGVNIPETFHRHKMNCSLFNAMVLCNYSSFLMALLMEVSDDDVLKAIQMFGGSLVCRFPLKLCLLWLQS